MLTASLLVHCSLCRTVQSCTPHRTIITISLLLPPFRREPNGSRLPNGTFRKGPKKNQQHAPQKTHKLSLDSNSGKQQHRIQALPLPDYSPTPSISTSYLAGVNPPNKTTRHQHDRKTHRPASALTWTQWH
ncbi:hypothetical protein BGX38DRAFT_76022 [Terfezia claveryi]|nr:hypothetical protein BGX38DRAFT_76022 [Terfezia claveryi]